MRDRLLALSLALCCLSPLAEAAKAPAPFDTVIRGGTVYDGSGAPGRRADVAIRDGKIVQVGDLHAASAKQVVDATGLAVAPGFTNMLSWSTEAFLSDGSSLGDLKQGVTFEVLGEGMTMGPLDAALKKRMQPRLAKQGVAVEWNTLGDYMRLLERKGVAPNIASFVGATNARMIVVGADNRKATPDELQRMQRLVVEAMREGALGVTSALAYAPAMYADTDELVALCKAAAPYGGIYISHIRDEGERLVESVDELIAIARAARVPAEIYHMKALAEPNWGKQATVISRVEKARAEGLRITADMYPYTASASGLDLLMPGWVREGGVDKWIERMRDKSLRERLVAEIGRSPRLSGDGAARIRLLKLQNKDLQRWVGRTVADFAADRGVSPAEAVIDLIAEDGSRVGVAYFVMSDENVAAAIRLPWMSFASDADSVRADPAKNNEGDHPRAFGTFARVLGKYVRDDRVITLPDAIHRLASLPMENLGIKDRGRLKPGFFADVVLFDPATIADRATFDAPQAYAVGVRDVFVNGVQVIAGGEYTGATPGRFVRGTGARQ